MSRPVLIDLDDIVGLERVWAELERVRAVRSIDPDLWVNIFRRCELLPAEDAAPILVDLDRLHPEVVLELHWVVLLRVVGERHPLGRAEGVATAGPPEAA